MHTFNLIIIASWVFLLKKYFGSIFGTNSPWSYRDYYLENLSWRHDIFPIYHISKETYLHVENVGTIGWYPSCLSPPVGAL